MKTLIITKQDIQRIMALYAQVPIAPTSKIKILRNMSCFLNRMSSQDKKSLAALNKLLEHGTSYLQFCIEHQKTSEDELEKLYLLRDAIDRKDSATAQDVLSLYPGLILKNHLVGDDILFASYSNILLIDGLKKSSLEFSNIILKHLTQLVGLPLKLLDEHNVLQDYIHENNIAMVQLFLHYGYNQSSNVYPIPCGVDEKSLEMAFLLIRETLVKNNHHYLGVILGRCAENNNRILALELLNLGVDPNGSGPFTATALALESGHLDFLTLLLDCGADVNSGIYGDNKREGKRNTLLHKALEKGNLPAVELLLGYRPNLFLRNQSNLSPFLLLQHSPYKDLKKKVKKDLPQNEFIDMVFDIDDTICCDPASLKLSEIQPFVTSIFDYVHLFNPLSILFMRWLIKWPTIRIAFMSAGSVQRNIPLVPLFLWLCFGEECEKYIKEGKLCGERVYSGDDVLTKSPDMVTKYQNIRAEGNAKDLTLVSPGKNVYIIDDNLHYAVKGQLKQWIYANPFDKDAFANEQSYLEYASLNGSSPYTFFKLAGLLHYAKEKSETEKIPLHKILFKRQFSEERSSYGDVTIKPRSKEKDYLNGVDILLLFLPEFENNKKKPENYLALVQAIAASCEPLDKAEKHFPYRKFYGERWNNVERHLPRAVARR